MKIVGFEANNGVRLGVVEGDDVIDLQGVDKNVPSDLGEVLRRSSGDLKVLADLAKNAPASARRPLAGLKYTLPVGQPGKIICLGLNYLDHVKEGPQRDNIPKFPSIFFRVLTSMVPHLQPIVRPKGRSSSIMKPNMVAIVGKRAKHSLWPTRSIVSPDIPARTKARCANSSATRRNGAWARILTVPAASVPGW